MWFVLVCLFAVQLCESAREYSLPWSLGAGNTQQRFLVVAGPFSLRKASLLFALSCPQCTDVEALWMTEPQLRYVQEKKWPSEYFFSPCFLPALQRWSVANGGVSRLVEVDVSETYYLVLAACGDYPQFQTIVNVKMSVLSNQIAVGDLDLARFRWWSNTFYVMLFGLYCFTMYAIPSSEQRRFWILYGVMLAMKLLVVAAEAAVMWVWNDNLVDLTRAWLPALHAGWQAFSAAFIVWVSIGPFYRNQGAPVHKFPAVVAICISYFSVLLPFLCLIVPGGCLVLRTTSVVFTVFFCWIFSLYMVLRHLRANKVVLDARAGRSPDQTAELHKRAALRVLRSALGFGVVLSGVSAFLLFGSTDISPTLAVSDMLNEVAFLQAFVVLLLALVSNFQAGSFIDMTTRSFARRQNQPQAAPAAAPAAAAPGAPPVRIDDAAVDEFPAPVVIGPEENSFSNRASRAVQRFFARFAGDGGGRANIVDVELEGVVNRDGADNAAQQQHPAPSAPPPSSSEMEDEPDRLLLARNESSSVDEELPGLLRDGEAVDQSVDDESEGNPFLRRNINSNNNNNND